MKRYLFQLLSVLVFVPFIMVSCSIGQSEKKAGISNDEKARVSAEILRSTVNAAPWHKVKKLLDGLEVHMPFDMMLAVASVAPDRIIYSDNNTTITVKGITEDSLGLILEFDIDQLSIGEETISNKVIVQAKFTPESQNKKINLIIDTDENNPILINSGLLDGAKVKFNDLSIQYCLNYIAIDPANTSGIVKIDNNPLSIDLVKAKLPPLPELPGEIPANSSGSLPKADLVFKTLNSLLKHIPWGNVKSVVDLIKPFSEGVLHQGDGFKISVVKYEIDPLYMTFNVSLDGFKFSEDDTESYSGNFVLTAGYIEGHINQRIFILLNTEENSPIIINGEDLDGTEIGFDELKIFLSLSDVEIDPLIIEGNLIVNGDIKTSGQLKVLLPAIIEQNLNEESSVESSDLTVKVLSSFFSSVPFKATGRFLILLNDIFETGKIDMSSNELSSLLNYFPPEPDGTIYSNNNLVVKIGSLISDPAELVLNFQMTDFKFYSEMAAGITGNFSLTASYINGTLKQKVLLLFNTEQDSPLVLSGDGFNGITIGLGNFKYFITINEVDIDNPIKVEGFLIVNGEPINDGVLDYLVYVLSTYNSGEVNASDKPVIKNLSYPSGSIFSENSQILIEGDVVEDELPIDALYLVDESGESVEIPLNDEKQFSHMVTLDPSKKFHQFSFIVKSKLNLTIGQNIIPVTYLTGDFNSQDAANIVTLDPAAEVTLTQPLLDRISEGLNGVIDEKINEGIKDALPITGSNGIDFTVNSIDLKPSSLSISVLADNLLKAELNFNGPPDAVFSGVASKKILGQNISCNFTGDVSSITISNINIFFTYKENQVVFNADIPNADVVVSGTTVNTCAGINLGGVDDVVRQAITDALQDVGIVEKSLLNMNDFMGQTDGLLIKATPAKEVGIITTNPENSTVSVGVKVSESLIIPPLSELTRYLITNRVSEIPEIIIEPDTQNNCNLTLTDDLINQSAFALFNVGKFSEISIPVPQEMTDAWGEVEATISFALPPVADFSTPAPSAMVNFEDGSIVFKDMILTLSRASSDWKAVIGINAGISFHFEMDSELNFIPVLNSDVDYSYKILHINVLGNIVDSYIIKNIESLIHEQSSVITQIAGDSIETMLPSIASFTPFSSGSLKGVTVNNGHMVLEILIESL